MKACLYVVLYGQNLGNIPVYLAPCFLCLLSGGIGNHFLFLEWQCRESKFLFLTKLSESEGNFMSWGLCIKFCVCASGVPVLTVSYPITRVLQCFFGHETPSQVSYGDRCYRRGAPPQIRGHRARPPLLCSQSGRQECSSSMSIRTKFLRHWQNDKYIWAAHDT